MRARLGPGPPAPGPATNRRNSLPPARARAQRPGKQRLCARRLPCRGDRISPDHALSSVFGPDNVRRPGRCRHRDVAG